MLEFFKKKPAGAPAAAAEEPVKLDENTAIHVMPERFRNQLVKKDSAKNMGLAIIIGGIVVLLVVAGVLYYFLFSKPKVAAVPEQPVILNTQPTATAPSQTEIIEPNATSSEPATLPTENPTATSTATSTTEATTTPESP